MTKSTLLLKNRETAIDLTEYRLQNLVEEVKDRQGLRLLLMHQADLFDENLTEVPDIKPEEKQRRREKATSIYQRIIRDGASDQAASEDVRQCRDRLERLRK